MYLEKNKNLSQDFYDMQGSIINGNKSNEVNVVNGLWLREPNRVGLDYQNIIKKYFEIEVKKITNAHEINTWVSKQTNNKINNIISQSQIDDLSYILLNATYFKGKWASIFEKENTKDEDFTLSNNTKIKVKMMQIFGEDYQFYEDNSLKMVELPYQTNEFSMYFILPNNKQTFQEIEKKINFSEFQQWYKKKNTEKLERLFIPRFRFDNLPNIDCLAILQKLGLNHPLNTKIMQKVFIEVDEEGTTAASIVEVSDSTVVNPKIKEFVANKPFFFVLRNNKTGVILFIGRVLSP